MEAEREDAVSKLTEERVEPCSHCGGDGGWEVVDGPDYVRGGAITHWQECRACDGSGEEEVECFAVTFDDLSHDLTMEEALRLDEEKLVALGFYDQ
jgi:hypothetical protein